MSYSSKKKRQSQETKINNRNIQLDHADILLLRDAAVDERETINFYSKTAKEVIMFSELFSNAAYAAMIHYDMLMCQISQLDPVQSHKMQRAGLAMFSTTSAKGVDCSEFSTTGIEEVPTDKKTEIIQILTDALIGELLTANKYQTYIKKAEEESTMRLFQQLLTDLKEHIAAFSVILSKLTDESLKNR